MNPAGRFPEGFLLGAAIAPHAAEGGLFASDWWRFEQRPGRILDRSNAQTAADHYARREADLTLAGKLGMKALLIGTDWSRVYPAPGQIDAPALEHYREAFSTAVRLGMEPVCVLYQDALPAWFADQGGWQNATAAMAFEDYAKTMAAALGPLCRRWITLYEPMHALRMAFGERRWPPAARWPLGAWKAARHMAQAHLGARSAIRSAREDAEVGLALRVRTCLPLDEDRVWDVRAARRHAAWPEVLLWLLGYGGPLAWDRKTGQGNGLDFLGITYYGVERYRFDPLAVRRFFARKVDAKGHPAGLYAVEPSAAAFNAALERMAQYGLPLLIAGNGIATDDDHARRTFLLDHLSVLSNFMARGNEVRGYFHRSLLDGFEHARGYTVRYGLIHVDWRTLARTPNPSAYLYKDICESRMIRAGAVTRFLPGWQPPVFSRGGMA